MVKRNDDCKAMFPPCLLCAGAGSPIRQLVRPDIHVPGAVHMP